MGKTLVIVESPTKAKKIASFLGDGYVVKATMGHIADLAKCGKYNMGVDFKKNFEAKYAIMPDKEALIKELEYDINRCDSVILLTDPDREGCGISMHLYSRLYKCNKPFKRALIQSINKKSFQSAIEKADDILSDQNMNLYKSQEARRILDRIIGFMTSPLLMEKHKQVLSAGRVQSVAVRMITDREIEIEKFKPKEYWNMFGAFKLTNKTKIDAKLDYKPTSKEDAHNAKKSILKYDEFSVKSVISQHKEQKPPPPLTTIALQKYMANRYSFSPEKTMQAAQSLYETGYCSYIRTDSTRASIEDINSAREWLAKNNFDTPKKHNEYDAKQSAQDAHECIHPVNINDLPKDTTALTKDEQLVYRAIWAHFVASQMKNAIWATSTITISPIKNDQVRFFLSGKTLQYKGYLEILEDEVSKDIVLPKMTEGDRVSLIDVKIDSKKTQPPPRYTDASLLKDLETKQIGRPATFSEIFRKITDRSYIEKNGNSYRPTELGRAIVQYLSDKFDFMEYKYSAEMEQKLDDIADGKLDQKEMLRNFFEPFQKKIDAVYIEMGHKSCSNCGSHMFERKNKTTGSKFYACSSCSNMHS